MLHVGLAGRHGFAGPELVLGSEAIYCDADLAARPVERAPGRRLLAAARAAFPEARVCPIGTSARVGGTTRLRRRGDGGLRGAPRLRARGVPALEVRAVVNEITSPTARCGASTTASRCCAKRAPAARGARCLSCRRRCRPASAPSGSSIAETIRLYGDNFWRALPLGLPIAVLDQLDLGRGGGVRIVLFLGVRAVPRLRLRLRCTVAGRAGPSRGRWPWRPDRDTRAAAGSLVFTWFALVAAVYLSFVGLSVPAAVLEGEPACAPRCAARVQLGRADWVHALGSIAALVVVFFLSRQVLVSLLRGQADETDRVAIFLADVVLAPLMLLGTAMLLLRPGAPASASTGSGAGARPTPKPSAERADFVPGKELPRRRAGRGGHRRRPAARPR